MKGVLGDQRIRNHWTAN